MTIKKSFDSLLSFPASSLSPPPLPPPCLLSDVHRSQDTRCDRSAVAPASCSLWPCCKRGVTSCLSLCLFLALPEGPRGTGRGCDGSTADPRGYGPPGPSPGCLPASAASADGHRRGPRSSCRIPGPFSLPPCPPPSPQRPHSTLKGAGTVTAASRLTVSQAQPWTHCLTASHSWPCTKSLTHAHTHSHSYIHTSARQPKDIQTQILRHRPTMNTYCIYCIYTFRDLQMQPYLQAHIHIIHTETQNHTHRLSHLHEFRPESPHRGYSLLPLAV